MGNMNIHPCHLYGAGGHVDKHEGGAHHLGGGEVHCLITTYSFERFFQSKSNRIFFANSK